MRYFLKGFLYGILGISLISLIWLMIVRPQLTARDAAELKDEYSETISGATSPGDSVGEESSVDILAMQRQYPDIKAWLTVPGTVIDYPVLQSSADDPEHYLRRNYDDTWRMAGSLFFQYDCTLDSRNLVIFGHNMSDGSMFACLRNMFDTPYKEIRTSNDLPVYQSFEDRSSWYIPPAAIAPIIPCDISFTQEMKPYRSICKSNWTSLRDFLKTSPFSSYMICT